MSVAQGSRNVEVRRLRGGSRNVYDVVDLVRAVPGLVTNRGQIDRVTAAGTIINVGGGRTRPTQDVWTTCTDARRAGLRR